MTDSSPGEGSIDLHSVDEDRLGDHLEGGDLLHLNNVNRNQIVSSRAELHEGEGNARFGRR